MKQACAKKYLRLNCHIAIAVCATLLFLGCTSSGLKYVKYTDTFFDVFDTAITIVVYAKTEQQFSSYFQHAKARFYELHQLYDIYNDYEGINNIKTINDNAGIRPVEVSKEIIDLLIFAKAQYQQISSQTNIAMGPVLQLWHLYREQGIQVPEHAELPPMDALQNAGCYTDLDKVIVDIENNTVFLVDKHMSLDVGSVAKGFAMEIVVQEMIAQGLESAMISAGGQIRTVGKPLDDIRERWGVGIHNPEHSIFAEDSLLDVIFINDVSVANSGDYQRYYMVDGQAYHHLIDPQTLMPSRYFSAVTVVANDSGSADFLSTALFLLPYEKSRALADSLDDVEVLWIMPDGSTQFTSGLKQIMRSFGATGSKSK